MARISFSTDMLPTGLSAEQKARCWADNLAGEGESHVDCPHMDGFNARIEMLFLNGILISRAYASSIRLQRTESHIAGDSKDGIGFLICDGARPIGGTQRGQEGVLRRGDAMVVSRSIPHMTHALRGGHALAVTIPRNMFARYKGDPDGFAGRMIDRNDGAIQLLGNYLGLLLASADSYDAAITATTANHVAELATLALGLPVHTHSRPGADGAADARLALIRQAIASRAFTEDVSAAAIGREFEISERTIQHLLKRAGTTFSDELREARVSRAEALLNDCKNDHLSIAQIAHECGFADVTTFYRAFRGRGGPSPSDIRAARKR